MSRNFFNVSAIYRGSQELDALYWGSKLKWRRDFQGQLPLENYSTATIKLTSSLTATLNMSQSYPCGVVVDWGDGTTPDIFEPTSGSISHSYSTSGTYEIKIYTYSGNYWNPGYRDPQNSTTYSFISASEKDSNTMLQGFTFGDHCHLNTPRAFYNAAALQVIDLTGQDTIPMETFYGCTALRTVIFDRDAASIYIDQSAFANCTSLYMEELPSNVTAILKNAFFGCTALPTYLEIKAPMVQAYAFANCTQLKRVWIRNTVTMVTAETTYSNSVPYYHGPFDQCDDGLVIYAEYAERPSGGITLDWDERFNYNGKHPDYGLRVIWNTQSKPEVSLNAVWNAESREIEYQDLLGEEDGYEYDSSDQSLVIY